MKFPYKATKQGANKGKNLKLTKPDPNTFSPQIFDSAHDVEKYHNKHAGKQSYWSRATGGRMA